MGAAADPADLDTRARAIAFRRLNGESYRTQELPGARSLHRGEVITDEEMMITRGDGSEAIILSSSSPLRDGQGDITGAVITFYDVTARRRMERAMQESLQRLYSIWPTSTAASFW